MKPRIILSVTIAALLAGCGEEKRAAEVEELKKQNADLAERMAAQERAVEKEKQALAEEKLSAAQAETDRAADANRAEADRLAEERASIDADRKRMEDDAARVTADQRAAMEAELRRRDDALKIAEMKAAAASRAKAEADEARVAAERAAKSEREASARREAERARNTPPAGAGRNSDFFYTALDPYGDWDEVEGYGPVFLPREAQQDRSWRPYTDGEWVRSEQGWTWRSNEPHGWATGHYGRWVRHTREGWMWVPGSEWAPAWVSWRKSDTHIGWAPLPPEAHSGRGFNASVDEYYDIGARNYNFVQRERFGAGRTYLGRIVEPDRNVTIIQNTVNVTNITYRNSGSGTVIVNEGPDINFVNARAAVPVQVVRLQREEVPEGRAAISTAVITAGLLRLVAPKFNHDRPVAVPRMVRKTATRDFDHGWAGADPVAEKVIREKAAAEARKAEEEERETFRRMSAEKKPPTAKPAPFVPPPPTARPVVPPAEKPVSPKAVVPDKVTPRGPVPPVEKPAAPSAKPPVVEKKPPLAPPVEPAPREIPKPAVKPAPEPVAEPAPKVDPPEKPADVKPMPPEVPKPEVPAEKPLKQPTAEPAIVKPVREVEKPVREVEKPRKEIERPKKEAPPTAKPVSETPAAEAKDALKKPVTLKPVKPVIAKPDAPSAEPIKNPADAPSKKPAEVNPKKPADPKDKKRDGTNASDLLKKKLTPEEKAALKDEAEKALKSLREKLGQ